MSDIESESDSQAADELIDDEKEGERREPESLAELDYEESSSNLDIEVQNDPEGELYGDGNGVSSEFAVGPLNELENNVSF
jgi:hypothetical protein